MYVLNKYRFFISKFYQYLLNGNCDNLSVTGKISIINRDKIWIGNDVILKKCCELHPSRLSKNKAIVIGDHSEIHEYTVLKTSGGYIQIGNYCSINMFGYVSGEGGVVINDFVRIGPRVNIISANHCFSNILMPIMYQNSCLSSVKIETDVWIGANVTILPGVTIGMKSVIGAGSVVTKNIPAYSVAVGNPAKVIKVRT